MTAPQFDERDTAHRWLVRFPGRLWLCIGYSVVFIEGAEHRSISISLSKMRPDRDVLRLIRVT